MSTEICRSTDVYWPSDGRHIDRLSADISVDVSAETRPLIVGRVSVDCQWYISQKLRLSVTDVYKAVASGGKMGAVAPPPHLPPKKIGTKTSFSGVKKTFD